MIIITNQPDRVTEWVELNCAEPSSYTVAGAPPSKIELDLTLTDQTLFDLMFAGWFIRNPRNDQLLDDTPINRWLISMNDVSDKLDQITRLNRKWITYTRSASWTA